MGKIIEIPQPLMGDANEKNAIAWIQQLVRFVGPGFHPDTLFCDYIKYDGRPSFSAAQSDYLETELSIACQLIALSNTNIYQVSLPIQRGLFDRSDSL